MTVVYYVHSLLKTRIDHLRAAGERDRGDSPVPTAIIIAGLAVAAAAVVAAAGTLAGNWMDSIDTP